jgi:hypothetical protein
VFEAYSSKVAEVHVYRFAIKKAANQELQRLHAQTAIHLKSGIEGSLPVSLQNMSFITAEAGRHHFYAFNHATTKQLMGSLIQRTNRQYQWLLVDAYELFEDYLEQSYACMGFSKKETWPLRDFGGSYLPELEEKSYEYFLKQSQGKKDRPYSILNQFRISLPHVRRFEVTNSLEINLNLAVAIIEKMRHFIVHLRGVVNDKEQATKQILERAGVYKNGNPSKADSSFLDVYFRLAEETNSICLLDIEGEPVGSLRTHFDVFEYLSNCLLTYAFTIRNALVERP